MYLLVHDVGYVQSCNETLVPRLQLCPWEREKHDLGYRVLIQSGLLG